MEERANFFTDTATLAVFDPAAIEHRLADTCDWWCDDFLTLDEFVGGTMALVELGSDGIYAVRVTDEELSHDERDYASEVITGLGTVVVSGRLFIGPGECIPGEGVRFSEFEKSRGMLLDIKNNAYAVDVYQINWQESPRWYRERGSPVPEDAPADFVVVLRERDTAPLNITKNPRFDGAAQQFLFESTTRQIGPAVDMILTTKVRKNGDGSLALKECGPCFYQAALSDYSRVN